MRIVSLVPSATEIVYALGLGRQLVGVSHDCDWPPQVRRKPIVTRPTVDLAGRSSRQIHDAVSGAIHAGHGLAELDEEALARLRPDLILTQELCSVCAVSYRRVNEAARSLDGPVQVVSLEPTTLDGIFRTIVTVGSLTARERRALDLVRRLRARLLRIEEKVVRRRRAGMPTPRVVALEWLDPPFVAGHWVPELIRRTGGRDVLGREGEPSRQTTWEAVLEAEPQMLLVMPCGFTVNEAVAELHRAPLPPFWGEIDAVRRGNVFALDAGAYFSRPGPRILDGALMLAEIFDPMAFVSRVPGAWTPVMDL